MNLLIMTLISKGMWKKCKIKKLKPTIKKGKKYKNKKNKSTPSLFQTLKKISILPLSINKQSFHNNQSFSCLSPMKQVKNKANKDKKMKVYFFKCLNKTKNISFAVETF